MASKPKYNPDNVERWVTVRGARIPIMKDGSFGVGSKMTAEEIKAGKEYVKENFKPATGVNVKDFINSDKPESKNAKYDTSRATKKNGATKEDIERDKETFRKAREQEQKVAQRKATGRQMVANARDAIKKYGPKRGMWEDFNAADKVWTSISKAYSSGEISREDYEKAYNIFGARFFEMRKTRNRKK